MVSRGKGRQKRSRRGKKACVEEWQRGKRRGQSYCHTLCHNTHIVRSPAKLKLFSCSELLLLKLINKIV